MEYVLSLLASTASGAAPRFVLPPAPWNVRHYDEMMFVAELIKVLFAMAFGACVGSLTNVLVYRLPLGLDVVRPQSRCPSCGTLLTWRENVPIFGWLFLKGRCRFCRSPISPEYPLVEAFVAVLFAAIYLVCYADEGRFLGINFGAIQPEWAANGFLHTWPAFIAVVVLFSCLVAMTLVDAKTFTIPMVLTTVPVVAGVVLHPLHALWVQETLPHGRLASIADGWTWTIASPGRFGWAWVGGSIGAVAGLVVSNVLVMTKRIKPSFFDYPEWEAAHLQALAAERAAKVGEATADGGVAVSVGDAAVKGPTVVPSDEPLPADLWIRYPHARREMIRELIFLAPAIGLGLLGSAIAIKAAGPWTMDPATLMSIPAVHVPLWLDALAGVLMGYLIGGGVVWLIRIAGSLAFGKEAMGLGDVHMMAAVGACIGWPDAVLGFFGAAFVGVAYAIASAIGGSKLKSLPYGPHLAVATVLVWFGTPAVERLIDLLVVGPVHVNLP